MSRRILCTVGTSLLTNGGWRRDQALPDREDLVRWLQTADPEKASAETNSLRALQAAGSDGLELLHSATHEGKLCAEVLRDVYRQRLRSAEAHEIPQLGYGAEIFVRGLKGLIELVLRLIEDARRRGQQPVLCATGGFKAEIAYLNLLGALLEVEVVYIHEQFRSLVRLPRLPLQWDEQFVIEHEDFFRWIDEEPRRSAEVETWLKGRPVLRTLVEDDDEGHTYLSAAGDLLYKAAQKRRAMAPRATWPEPDPRPPEKKNCVSAVEHHRPPGWGTFVDRLCRIDCVSSVRFDQAAIGGPTVRVLDSGQGTIGVRFEKGGAVLPLRVETTARGDDQCELVASYLSQLR